MTILIVALLMSPVCVCQAQDSPESAVKTGAASAARIEQTPMSGVGEHWKYFLQETFGALSAGGTVFNAGFSQLTNSDPRYGSNSIAFGQRVGASAADIGAQNFFGDFLVASAFHEDPRYIRLGEGYSFRHRVGYTLSRAIVTRTSSGGSGFNWDNFIGSAMGTGFSNLYYPPQSRTGGAMLIHFATDIADAGFVNLAPEFWPDFRRKVLHWHRAPSNGRSKSPPED